MQDQMLILLRLSVIALSIISPNWVGPCQSHYDTTFPSKRNKLKPNLNKKHLFKQQANQLLSRSIKAEHSTSAELLTALNFCDGLKFCQSDTTKSLLKEGTDTSNLFAGHAHKAYLPG